MRLRRGSSEEIDADVTPLIDCVFLLLIFFLVTSMIKRFDRQIPVSLADASSVVEEEMRNDVFDLAVDAAGGMYAAAGREGRGVVFFHRVEEPAAYLKKLAAERGTKAPLQITVDRKAPFQEVIRSQDLLELQGFRNVRFRLSDRPVAERAR